MILSKLSFSEGVKCCVLRCNGWMGMSSCSRIMCNSGSLERRREEIEIRVVFIEVATNIHTYYAISFNSSRPYDYQSCSFAISHI